MSDQEHREGATAGHPSEHPQAAEVNEVVVDDSASEPTYANFCRVMATPEEVILDFGLNLQPFAPGPQNVRANHRIVMNEFTTKRLLAALGMTIQRHEQTFGAIELDVQRRVAQGPPATPAPDEPPKIIRL